MSIPPRQELLRLPTALESQLGDFRRRVWTIKMAEAAGVAVFALAIAYLCVFALDRLWDTPRVLRFGILMGAISGCAIVPAYVHRWIWGCRCLEQLAQLLSVKLPRLGDPLLGIIELSHSEGEQARSRTLCEAAIRQVAADAQKHDLFEATPNCRYRMWGGLAVAVVAVAVGLGAFWPLAAFNAWGRFLAPWANTPRYTFAAVEPLPQQIVVPHGEPFRVTVRLAAGSLWRPQQGLVQLGTQRPVSSPLRDGQYQFDLPSQIDGGRLHVSIGDSRHLVEITPMGRPELTSLMANVTLPEYLGRPKLLTKDVRGGSVSLVKGSRATFVAKASRDLSAATVDGRPQTPDAALIRSPAVNVGAVREMVFQWKDRFGLGGKGSFTLAIAAGDDEAPTLTCEDLPRSKVVLDSEQLAFRVKAQDDFGVKRIGMEWQGIDNAVIQRPAKGERILVAGGFEKESIDGAGTFSAKSLGIEPQPIHLRIFAEDYYPGRSRVYSPTYVLYVLSPEQHAIWMTEQLSKWHRQALEVRDRELQLYETNKQLRGLAPEELDQPATRRRIETQAAAERANSRRLSNLAASGEDLLRQASRNPEFGVGHLDRWAEMLQILKDIAANRMPSVADLLDQASKARTAAASKPNSTGPKVGQARASASGASKESREAAKQAAVPQIVDTESSLQRPANDSNEPSSRKNASTPSLRLPTTTLIGGGGAKGDPSTPSGEKMDAAVGQQQDLLAEFEKIVNELNNILATLEGSTLVKRLKAASREQSRVAGRVGDLVEGSFGASAAEISPPQAKAFTGLADVEAKSSQNVSLIMDDMQAYFERRRFMKFKAVLDDMKAQDVVGGLRQLADEVRAEPGLSIAQCEYWWDTLDRWAEDLVDPASSGQCRGSGSRASLPPSIVLEVLQILEAEVNLRTETRVAEQAKPALTADDYGRRGRELSGTQNGLEGRVKKVTDQIRQLPDGETEFGPEIELLTAVAEVMHDAAEILARPETGSPAIGAETEAIELLLQSRRINPKGGGGGGASPGGGGGGTTVDSALALLGIGVNEKDAGEKRDVQQAVGDSGRSPPEEFRAGLDEYFSRLEHEDQR
jgi:hypothetical protein